MDDTGHALPPGTRLGDYLIEDVIGTGGFSIVYGASDNIGRRLAIKEYMPESLARRSEGMTVTARSQRTAATFAQGMDSFVKEAKTLARFNSPAIVQVYTFWQANGTAYMAMPLYTGNTLKAELQARADRPDEAFLRRMLASLLDVLAILHAERVWHRDIAPDNILMQDGQPVLLDFGAARRVIGEGTQNLTAILKPGYAPWEQYGEAPGMEQGPWTDLYALGAVLYWAIGGKVPPVSVSRAHADTMVPASVIGQGRYSAQFLALIDRALAVRPADRPQSVAEFKQALAQPATVPVATPLADDDQATRILAAPVRTTASAPAAAAPGRSLQAVGLIGLLALLLALGGGVVWWLRDPGRPAAPAAAAASAPAQVVLPSAPEPAAAPVPTQVQAPVAQPAPTAPPAAVQTPAPTAAATPPSATATRPAAGNKSTAARPATPTGTGNQARCAALLQSLSLGQDNPQLREQLSTLHCY